MGEPRPGPSRGSPELALGPLLLDARRAMVIPGARTALISDLHLGKARSFRAAGLAIPEGSDATTLDRLGALVAHHQIQRLVVVGDLIHNTASLSDALAALWQGWREPLVAQGLLDSIVLLPGNHDRRAVRATQECLEGLEVLEHWSMDLPAATIDGAQGLPRASQTSLAIAAAHEPADFPEHLQDRADLVRVVGHVHPVGLLMGPGRDRLRLPIFVRDARLWTLPAFGEFTGGHVVEAHEAEARYAVGAGCVWPLPQAPISPRRATHPKP